jgi:hypothetical protein
LNPFSQLAPNGEQIFPEGIILHRQGGVLKLTIDRINDLNHLMPEVFLRIESNQSPKTCNRNIAMTWMKVE